MNMVSDPILLLLFFVLFCFCFVLASFCKMQALQVLPAFRQYAMPFREKQAACSCNNGNVRQTNVQPTIFSFFLPCGMSDYGILPKLRY